MKNPGAHVDITSHYKNSKNVKTSEDGITQLACPPNFRKNWRFFLPDALTYSHVCALTYSYVCARKVLPTY